MKTKIGIYAGSFDPFHLGHLNILEKAECLFGENNVIIAVGSNPAKADSKKTLPQRAFKVEKQLPDKYVISYDCFVHELIYQLQEKNPENEYWLVRGLRSGEDLLQETTQLKFIQDMMGSRLNSVFLVCDKEFEHISSSAIRILESARPGEGLAYLGKSNPDYVVVSYLGHDKIQLASVEDVGDGLLFRGKYEMCVDFIDKRKRVFNVKKLKLTDRMITTLVHQPEHGMGYQTVDVVLRNGDFLRNRKVVDASYLLLEDFEELVVDDIAEIVLINTLRHD